MEYCGFEGQDRICLQFDKQDKGQIAEIEQFADAVLNDTDSPNGLLKAARAAIISYKVNESIQKAGPVSIDKSDYIFE